MFFTGLVLATFLIMDVSCQTSLSEEDKTTILNSHNTLRGLVNPTASNMETMVWNDELAQVAQTYAEQCDFEHNPDRVSQQATFSSVGENLFASSGMADYEGFVQGWYDEVADYDYASNSCGAGAVCGHYTQVVWAASRSLGCGAFRCPVLQNAGNNWVILVCNYGPAGNVVGRSPYVSGPSCSGCGRGTPFCLNNLCSAEQVDTTTAAEQVDTTTAAEQVDTTTGQGQTCTSITDVTMSGEEFLVDVSGTPCLRCLNSLGQSEPLTQWILGSLIVPGTPNPPGLDRRSDGALVFLDPLLYIVGGSGGTLLSCLNSEVQLLLNAFSNVLLPPVVGAQSLTILEGRSGSVNCFDPNPTLLGVQQVWIDPMGGETIFSILNLVNITRAEAGDYVCNFTASDGQSLAVVLPVTVQYGPEATTTEVPFRNLDLGGSLSLRCDFDGVPTPSVVWLLNGTVELNSTNDSRVAITTMDGVSVLNIMNLDQLGFGVYSCGFSSSVGDLVINVTTIVAGCGSRFIGSLPTLFHGVSGIMYVVNDNTFCIDRFNYDGFGPDAFLYFYYPGDDISDTGGGVYVPLNNERAQFEVGRGYVDETLTFELSNKYKACDFEGFGIWCRYANQLFTSITWSNADIFGDDGGRVSCNPSPGRGYAGVLPTLDHAVSGELYIRDNKTFVIRDFTYDGQGRDVFVYWYPVGAVADPTGGGQIIPLPAPEGASAEEGQFSTSIAYTLPQEDFVITIPDNLDVFTCDIGTFTIWSRAFRVFFTVLAINGEVFTNNPLERDYQPDRILCDRPATRPGVLVGELPTTDTRAISGTFYVQDEYTFFIQLFSYDASRDETYLYYYPTGLLPDFLIMSGEGGVRIPFSADSVAFPVGRFSSFYNNDFTVDLTRVLGGPISACAIGYFAIFDESVGELLTMILIPDDIFGQCPDDASGQFPDDSGNLTIIPSKPLSVLLGDYISLNCSSTPPADMDISYTWAHLNTSTILEETSNILTFPRISVEELGTYRCSASDVSLTGAEVTITSARPLIDTGSYPARIIDGACPSSQSSDDVIVDVLQLLSAQFGVRPLGLTMSYSAESCDQVAEANPKSPPGMYWIYVDGNPVQIFCQF